MGQKVEDPVAEGGGDPWVQKFGDEFRWDYGIVGGTIVNK